MDLSGMAVPEQPGLLVCPGIAVLRKGQEHAYVPTGEDLALDFLLGVLPPQADSSVWGTLLAQGTRWAADSGSSRGGACSLLKW